MILWLSLIHILKQGAAQGFRDRWGIGWYRRTLTLLEVKPDMIYYLIFEGIYENSTVWVNGMEAGGGKYGYTRIKLDVTAYLQIGENRIEAVSYTHLDVYKRQLL